MAIDAVDAGTDQASIPADRALIMTEPESMSTDRALITTDL